jgi:hypothetical protein
MGCRRQTSFNTHDPLGLIAAPMVPASGGVEHSVGDYPKLLPDHAQPTRVPTAVKTIGAGLVTAVLIVTLVAPPGSGTESGTPSRTGISKSFAEWCPFSAPHLSASRESINELVDRAWITLR